MYAVGEKYVAGPHGVGEIIAVGAEVVLHFPVPNATQRIPIEKAAELLRPACSKADADRVMQVLAAPTEPSTATNFQRRYSAQKDKLNTGCLDDIAEVYRDLGRRKALSYSEKSLWHRAGKLLVCELGPHVEDAEAAIRREAGCLR